MLKIFLLLGFLLFSCSAFTKEPINNDWIKNNIIKLKKTNDLNKLIKQSGNSKLVLLGESTHGTSEYYYWRAEISKQLIQKKGYSFIAVEGDWASIYKLNLYVKGISDEFSHSREILKTFNRWPEWMWANEEIVELAEWMKKYNSRLAINKRVGFYGMDVYGQWEAIEQVIDYVNEYFPEYSDRINNKYNCYLPYKNDDWSYPQALISGATPCIEPLNNAIELIYTLKDNINTEDYNLFFNAKQNAYVVKNAETYFRIAPQNNVQSWNSRVDHMFETVKRLLAYYGDNSKGIVWAHNTHIGDASATSMLGQGMYNIGNISRTKFGRENVFLLGFATYSGKVNAGLRWADNMQIMEIPSAIEGSIEHHLNSYNKDKYYLLFDNNSKSNKELSEVLPHRAIGVTYNPENERGNYVPTILNERYDGIVFITNTNALTPVK